MVGPACTCQGRHDDGKALAIHNIQEDSATLICVRADMAQACQYNLMNRDRKTTSEQLLENYSGPDAKRQPNARQIYTTNLKYIYNQSLRIFERHESVWHVSELTWDKLAKLSKLFAKWVNLSSLRDRHNWFPRGARRTARPRRDWPIGAGRPIETTNILRHSHLMCQCPLEGSRSRIGSTQAW